MKLRFAKHLLSLMLLTAAPPSARAFSLLGPFAPWMDYEKSYRSDGDIGGPMQLGEGYRWNVPVVTYGFDPQFVSHFGSNGVAAVESAIQILNNLPPVSILDPTNYPMATVRINYRARILGLYDLKSMTLGVLVEQMGLADSQHFIFCLRDYQFVDGIESFDLISRNFDPATLAITNAVNGEPYVYFIRGPAEDFVGTPADAIEALPQSGAFGRPGVSSWPSALGYGGGFYTGLTFDDVGGLKYLYDTNNIAMESLLPGVRGAGTNADNYVTAALRPGVDKITLQRLEYDSSQDRFVSITNQFVDSYLAGGTLHQQLLERAITSPDIVFTVGGSGFVICGRTPTTNWVNNGAPTHDGPGVIQPPITIMFNRFGSGLYHYATPYPDPNPYHLFSNAWGSFDGTTNPRLFTRFQRSLPTPPPFISG